MPQLEHLSAQLDRLAALDPGPYPVLSLYLNLQADDRGRDRFEPFLRKELDDRVRTYPAAGPERESLQKDAGAVEDYVRSLDESSNGLAIFACAGAGLFEAIQLAAPIDQHRLYISDQPHLYPLARLIDEYPRYLALLVDTHSARIFVFAASAIERTAEIEGIKTRRHKMGGWSQARYQRHIENYHLQHAKEIADIVARTMREEHIDRLVISGDQTIVPLVREQMPKDIVERIVDVVRLDRNAPDRAVLDATIAALREQDAQTDRERVDELIGAYRAHGLACIGIEQTRRAFALGQVDELVIAATPAALKGVKHAAGDGPPDRSAEERAADELIVQARNTSAKIRFVEDASLLQPIGGVGAFLRFKLEK